MLPSDIADLREQEELEANRPPDVARYYALLAALDAVYLNTTRGHELTQNLAGRLGFSLDMYENNPTEPSEPSK